MGLFTFNLDIGYWLLKQSKICLQTKLPYSLFEIPYSKFLIQPG